MNLEGALRVLTYIKKALGKRLIDRCHSHLHIEDYSNSGYPRDKGDWMLVKNYCTYVGDNLII